MNAPLSDTTPELACAAFTDELRRLREVKGVAQSELARRLNIKPPYLSAVERLQRPPPGRRFIDSVCAALGLDDQEATLLLNKADQARKNWKRLLSERRLAQAKSVNSEKSTSIEISVDGRCMFVISIPNTSPGDIQVSCPVPIKGALLMT